MLFTIGPLMNTFPSFWNRPFVLNQNTSTRHTIGGKTMSVTQQTMTDEQRKSVALEYLKRLDRGENFFDLFADDAQVCFPKWGVANGRAQIEKLFSEFASILSSIRHDYAYF